MVEGKEGDWECGSCRNHNYAFRSFCNRCKQPRLLVDKKTPSDSKWLPRIGDWICSGCTNNNYASREKCKKCGQPKKVAAMPAIAMAGASIPTHAYYFARTQGGPGLNMNQGLNRNPFGLQQVLSTAPGWPLRANNNLGLQAASSWSFGGDNSSNGCLNNINQLPVVPKGWRNGDWLCNRGFHNYSSRVQCKKCNASLPSSVPSSAATSLFPASGTKRLASEEFGNGLDSKRLNAGDLNSHILTNRQQFSYGKFPQTTGSNNNLVGKCSCAADKPVPQQMMTIPTFVGKSSKHWRDGDWICTNCNNHNYASRLQCNRCNTQRSAIAQTVNVV